MPLRARHTSFMQASETYMIPVACPHLQNRASHPINRMPDKIG
jgi:hypothetical protein